MWPPGPSAGTAVCRPQQAADGAPSSAEGLHGRPLKAPQGPSPATLRRASCLSLGKPVPEGLPRPSLRLAALSSAASLLPLPSGSALQMAAPERHLPGSRSAVSVPARPTAPGPHPASCPRLRLLQDGGKMPFSQETFPDCSPFPDAPLSSPGQRDRR